MSSDDVADYVVVGGGTAGCVVASRLSEDPALRVVLLEAGGENRDVAVSVPGRATELWTGLSAWPNLTQPQAGAGGRVVPLLTGTGLGGGSSINAMGWLHGHPDDYGRWVAAGADGWGASDMGRLMRLIEDHELGASDYHGAGGPMAVSTPVHVHPLVAALSEAATHIGWSANDDLNGSHHTGFGLLPCTIRAGARHSVVDGYLEPARQRGNLQVQTRCPVGRVDLEARRAVGVTCSTPDGPGRHIRARRGVILAAGALRTPQLLMLSGIGPADQLSAHEIPVEINAPGVGQGLVDHPAIVLPFGLSDALRGEGLLYERAESAYELLHRGPLAAMGQWVALMACGDAIRDSGAPPELILSLLLSGREQGLEGDSGSALTVGLLDPRSSGTVSLASSSPLDVPLVDPRYLSAPGDRPRLREGIRRARQLLESEVLRGRIDLSLMPTTRRDEEIDAYIDTNLVTFFHPVGTAAMGSGEPAVVDYRLGVRGAKNLWVADASVMPAIPRGLTQAPTIAIAERAAQMIVERVTTRG